MLNTIRARLTLWYATVLTAVLVAFGLGVYILLSQALHQRVDAGLQSMIDITRTSLTHDAQEGQSRDSAAHTTVEELASPQQALAIFDADGKLLAAAGWDDFEPRLPASHADAFHVYTMPEDDDDDEHVRLATQRVRIAAFGAGYIVLAGQSLEPVEDELESLRQILWYVVPVAVMVAGLGGWAIARQSLLPVSAMSSQARTITAQALGARMPIVNPADELGGLAQSFNDLLQRLEESFATQRRFMADASHELRTPIATSRTAVSVTLKQPHRDEAEYREALRIVEEQTWRLTRIVDDMLTLARADAGEYPLRVVSFYLDELVQDVARGARVLARAGARVEVSAPVETPFTADEDLLRRMLLNLVDNALQHTPPSGEIRLALEQSNGEVRIIVADNGPGIPIEAQAHIFERFYRADRARARRDATEGTGAGLGLAIAKWIAEAHQGRLVGTVRFRRHYLRGCFSFHLTFISPLIRCNQRPRQADEGGPMRKRTRLILLLGALLTVGGVTSVWLGATLAAQGAALPADTGDLSNASTVEVKDAGGVVVLSGHLVEVPEDDDDLERKAELRGSGISAKATGQAEVEVSKTNNRLDQEVEVSVSNLTPGSTYAVFIDGKQLGTFQTNKNGRGELELNTPAVTAP